MERRCVMSYNWGPHYLVPSQALKSYSGIVRLRETFDEDLLHKELKELGFTGSILRVTNPWYYRKVNADTWIEIGESDNRGENFAVTWDTTNVENGQYQVMGLMHVFVPDGNKGIAIVRQNIVEVTVEN
jgi:hypothetical protein